MWGMLNEDEGLGVDRAYGRLLFFLPGCPGQLA
jgi:hypothetical protein